jgi:hypothetical protein
VGDGAEAKRSAQGNDQAAEARTGEPCQKCRFRIASEWLIFHESPLVITGSAVVQRSFQRMATPRIAVASVSVVYDRA